MVKEVKDIPIKEIIKVQEGSLNAYNHTFVLKDKNGYNFRIGINQYPTDNCQVSSFGNAQNFKHVRQDVFARVIKEMRRYSNKQIIVDIKVYGSKTFFKLIEPYLEVNFQQNYQSTNGSNMIMILYKWKI